MKLRRIAIPVWADHICVVLDFAQSILVIEVEGARERSRQTYSCPSAPPVCLATRLYELGVQVVICGALSYPLMVILQRYDIRVIPYVQGHVDEIFKAFLDGTLSQPQFRLPGTLPLQKWRKGRRGRWTRY